MATISQDEVRLLIRHALTNTRDKVDAHHSSTMLKGELKACAGRLLVLGELLGNDDKVVVSATMLLTEDIQAVDELFTQKGV